MVLIIIKGKCFFLRHYSQNFYLQDKDFAIGEIGAQEGMISIDGVTLTVPPGM